MVREFGDNDTAGTPSRKHSKNQQGYLSDSHLAETVGPHIFLVAFVPKNICSF